MIQVYRIARHSLQERETSCLCQALKITAVKKAERLAGKMLCFPQRSLLHYVLLLEIEAQLARWAPLMGQAHIHLSVNLPWCCVTCGEVTGHGAGGSLAASSEAPGGLSVEQLPGECSLMGWAPLLFCLKTSWRAVLQFCCSSPPLTLTTGAARGSPQCSKATFQSGPASVHVSRRRFVKTSGCLQGCLSS